MEKFLKNNVKLIIGIIIGIILACHSIVFAYTFTASEIRHVKSDNTETSVDIALNELYQMYDADNIILSKIYPVGSYFLSSSNVNPSTIFGGTWQQVGQGRTIVGEGTNGGYTFTAGSTGTTVGASTNPLGEYTHQLSVSEMPSHNHGGATGYMSANWSHSHGLTMHDTATFLGARTSNNGGYLPSASSWGATNSNMGWGSYTVNATDTNHTHSISSQGGNASHNNIQPYLVTYIWHRTA